MKAIFAFSLMFASIKLLAYPSMNRHGYTNCVGCHYAPQGGGLLTAYGKSIAKAFSMPGGDYKQSELKKAISFNGSWEQALQFRLANLRKETETVTFPMQGDFLAGAKVGQRGFLNATLAKLPERGKGTTTNQESGFFTEYLVRSLGYVHPIDNNFTVQLERGRLPLGLNIEDHSTFIKRRNKNDTTDLVSRLAFLRQDKISLSEIHLFAPSGQEKEGNEEWGALGKYEWYAFKHIFIGGQLLYGKTDGIERDLQGFFSRGSIFKDIGWLAEINRTGRKIEGNPETVNQWTSYVKLSYFLRDWLELYGTKEKVELDKSFESESNSSSLGLRFVIITNLTLQVDHKITEIKNNDNKLTMIQAYLNWW
jgi:hypothetical protein